MKAENKSSSFKESHKELYGLLMLVNQRINSCSSYLIWVLCLSGLGFCVSIHMRWFDPVFGIPVDKLRGFGVYTLIAVVTLLIFVIINEFREKNIYRQARPEIIESLKTNAVSVEALLADIANDKNLEEIKGKLLDDKDIQQPDRTILR